MHVLDAAINLAPYGFLCNLGNQYKDCNCYHSDVIAILQHSVTSKCLAINAPHVVFVSTYVGTRRVKT